MKKIIAISLAVGIAVIALSMSATASNPKADTNKGFVIPAEES